jgi:NO-binding membrane sensor protein with MHYT domain
MAMNLLAQINWEQAGVVFGGIVTALAGQWGVKKGMVTWRTRNNRESVRVCAVHQEAVLAGITRLESGMNTLDIRIDSGMNKLENRIDILMQQDRKA